MRSPWWNDDVISTLRKLIVSLEGLSADVLKIVFEWSYMIRNCLENIRIHRGLWVLLVLICGVTAAGHDGHVGRDLQCSGQCIWRCWYVVLGDNSSSNSLFRHLRWLFLWHLTSQTTVEPIVVQLKHITLFLLHSLNISADKLWEEHFISAWIVDMAALAV